MEVQGERLGPDTWLLGLARIGRARDGLGRTGRARDGDQETALHHGAVGAFQRVAAHGVRHDVCGAPARGEVLVPVVDDVVRTECRGELKTVTERGRDEFRYAVRTSAVFVASTAGRRPPFAPSASAARSPP